MTSNFAFLARHDENLARLGLLAEKYLADDPNTCLLKLRQFSELLALTAAARMGLYRMDGESAYDLQRRLRDEHVLPQEVYLLFKEIRRAGNDANHELYASQGKALNMLKLAWQLAVWFERTFGQANDAPATFANPLQPLLASPNEEKQTSLERLERETEAAKSGTEARLQVQQYEAGRKAAATLEKYRVAAQAASQQLHLDEPATRQLIDTQLRQAGWEADTLQLRYSNGTRPQRGRNLAIAEWPTASGPADYVLFVGLTPIAVVEAKRQNVDVSAALVQARRYSRGFDLVNGMQAAGGPWSGVYIPFAFSSNGRPYLRQMETLSGIWFADLRRPENASHALDGWYTPDGLRDLLKRDEDTAHRLLADEPFDYGFELRYYQKDAIRAVEDGIAIGRRELLVAMATGTGKTKTCIALLYRLLKTQRFKRVLFLVDRKALGEQAANAFKDTRMEGIQSFADIFGTLELDESTPASNTAVQIATVQGMMQRLLYPAEGQTPPAVDAYDCIVVDECHRGYQIDRDLSEAELTFRSYEDYVSKYRKVIEYFDAVRIGLTATPALHTTQIFGMPIFTYSYREAVVDGYLIDHEPPIQIKTKLSAQGITWQVGQEVKIYDPVQGQVSLYTTPDEIHMEVDAFNKRVLTKEFNAAVCSYLAREIDPFSPQKTLIFCAKDSHADLLVELLKQAYRAQYGGVDDEAILKITGTSDKPLELIRRFKNERNPTIAVTVDLLTTGVDIPEICNLVFLRRVNSRILFDQMLGRATRLCPEIGKETFRVFDAVRLYEALGNLTAMQPVVTQPNIRFSQLIAELMLLRDTDAAELVREQLLAKFQRKKQRLSEANAHDLETVAGMSPNDFAATLRSMSSVEMAEWFVGNPLLSEILDRINESRTPQLISEHPDEFLAAERGYGNGVKPEDYLHAFGEFIRSHRDEIPALLTVLTRPRDLTRKQLRELALALDQAGFSETGLTMAWRESTNQEIAAHIVGFIRHLATGDPLIPYEQRVDWALQQMLNARHWTNPQRDWLRRIAAQTRANIVVDREALDDPDLVFKREGGGFPRLNRLFDGRLAETLDEFHDLLWKQR